MSERVLVLYRKDWVSEVSKQSLHQMTQSALQGGVGELHSALVPGEQPFGGFSPPVSPAKPPALQVALARNFPVSRLNPLPTVQQLMHQHKAGKLTQAQLWLEIERLRKHWAAQRQAAEQRVHEQRAYRDMLFGSMTGSRAATARATNSAPMRLQPVEIDVSASTTRVSLPGGRPTADAPEFLSDGRNVSGVQSTDERADAILARLNAIAKPDSLMSPSSMRRGSSASMPDSSSYRPTPPGSRASFNGGGSRAGSRASSRVSTQSARSGSRSSRAGKVSKRRGNAADILDVEPANYQEVKAETKEWADVEAAEEYAHRHSPPHLDLQEHL